jgi:thiol-disulfide isomerase/thioredoxin
MRRLAYLLVPGLVLLGTILGCARDEPVKGVDVTEARAADFEKAVKDQKGKVVLVDCWATWCAPCVKNFPHLVGTHKKYAEKGLVCVSLNMDKYGDADAYSKDKVLKFLKDKGAAFPNFILTEPKKDEKEFETLLGDYYSIPYMVLFDRNGRRVWASDERPKLTDEQIDKKIEALLAEKP